MYADTVTVFNRYSSRFGDAWYPTVIPGADLNVDKAAILAKYGAESGDSAKLHIRYQRRSDGIYIAEKPYLLPKEWEEQTNDELASSITFASGEAFDFFFAGKWDGGVVVDSEYTGGFYEYMNRHFDLVFAISSVARYSLIPHFEIMGR